MLTDDCEYENVGMGVCHGPEEVRALLGAFFATVERMAWTCSPSSSRTAR